MKNNLPMQSMVEALLLESDGDMSSPGMLLLEEAIVALKNAYTKLSKLELFFQENRSSSPQKNITPERTAKRDRSHEGHRDYFGEREVPTPAGLEQFTDADLSELPRKRPLLAAQKPEETFENKNKIEYKVYFRLTGKKIGKNEVMEAFSSHNISNFRIIDFKCAGNHSRGFLVTEDYPTYVKVLEQRYGIRVGNKTLFIGLCRQN